MPKIAKLAMISFVLMPLALAQDPAPKPQTIDEFLKVEHKIPAPKSDFESKKDWADRLFNGGESVFFTIPIKYGENIKYNAEVHCFEVEYKDYFDFMIDGPEKLTGSYVGENVFGVTFDVNKYDIDRAIFQFVTQKLDYTGKDFSPWITTVYEGKPKTANDMIYEAGVRIRIPCDPATAPTKKDDFAWAIKGPIANITKKEGLNTPTIDYPRENTLHLTNYYMNALKTKLILYDTKTNQVFSVVTFKE